MNPREKKAVLKKCSVCVQLQKTVRVWWMRFARPPEQAGWDREQERGLEESGPSKAPHPSGWSRGGSERELGKQPGQFVKGKARAQDV